jgi:hypothetical protein
MPDNRTAELELRIDGDAAFATTVLESCDVAITKPKPTRFIVEAGAIIGVTAGLVKLINALIDLADRLRKNPHAPTVVASDVGGKQLILNNASKEAITSFVHASADQT